MWRGPPVTLPQAAAGRAAAAAGSGVTGGQRLHVKGDFGFLLLNLIIVIHKQKIYFLFGGG